MSELIEVPTVAPLTFKVEDTSDMTIPAREPTIPPMISRRAELLKASTDLSENGLSCLHSSSAVLVLIVPSKVKTTVAIAIPNMMSMIGLS